MNIYVAITLFLINLFSFILVGLDKHRAKVKGWRISEKSFFVISLLLGAIGVYIGMEVFRHKTKHNSFKYGIPLIIAVNVLSYIYIYK